MIDKINHDIDHIVNEDTKRYFSEVVSAYTNGNYRSAIVLSPGLSGGSLRDAAMPEFN